MAKENELRINIPQDFALIEPAEFGEVIDFGEVAGQPVRVSRPLNDPARHEIGPLGILAVALHDRISSIERQLQELKDRDGGSEKG